jgi:hypothetical protein
VISHSGGVESKLCPLGTSANEWPIVPAPGECDDGEFGGMKIGRGNRSTRRKPAPAPLYPPQIPLARPGLEKDSGCYTYVPPSLKWGLYILSTGVFRLMSFV